jgi:hypothetical protein
MGLGILAPLLAIPPGKKKKKKKNNHFYAQGIKKEVTKQNLQKQEKERAKSNSAHTPGGSFAA